MYSSGQLGIVCFEFANKASHIETFQLLVVNEAPWSISTLFQTRVRIQVEPPILRKITEYLPGSKASAHSRTRTQSGERQVVVGTRRNPLSHGCPVLIRPLYAATIDVADY